MRRLLVLLACSSLLFAGTARRFDRVDDTITMGNVLNFERTDPFSVALWHRDGSLSPTVNMTLIGKEAATSPNPGYRIDVEGTAAADPYLVAVVNHGATNKILVRFPRVNDTNWHCLVVTYSGSSLASGVKLYRDGVAQTPTVVSDTLSLSILHSEPFRISGLGTSVIQLYAGDLAHVSIYSMALTEGQAGEYCHSPNQAAGIAARWRLWENGASPAYVDEAGALDGTATAHPTEQLSNGPPIFLPGGPL